MAFLGGLMRGTLGLLVGRGRERVSGGRSRRYAVDRPQLTLNLPRPTRRPRVPRIKSAKKAMRQARARFTHNRAQRSALRTALKHVRQAATAAAAAQAYAL